MSLAFSSGGVVMWPLLISSITSITCIIERFLYWNSIKWHNRNTFNKILNNFKNDPDHINEYLLRNSKSPLSFVLLEALNYQSSSSEFFHFALTCSLKSIIPRFRRFDDIFSTIITLSPLLGLLGTIIGLIKSFSLIDIGKIGVNSQGVTSGISEALVSTAAGLIVAIFTLIFANYFRSISNHQISLIQEYTAKIELINSERKYL